MKHQNWVIFFLLIITHLALPIHAQEDYEPEELPTLVGDFNLSGIVLDEKGNPLNGPVNRVATIRISRQDQLEETYSLVLYLDKMYVASINGISLPYDFKWNFRGLLPGDYELFFVLKDSQSKLGVLQLNVTVEH